MKTKILFIFFFLLLIITGRAQLSVSITPQAGPLIPCNPITFTVTLNNTSGIDLAPEISLTFANTTGFTFTPATGVTSNTITSGINITSATLMYSSPTLLAGTTEVLTFTTTLGCNAIPISGFGASVSYTASVANVGGQTVTVNGGANGATGNVSFPITFPALSYTASDLLNSPASITYSGSAITQRMIYTNGSITTFNGCAKMEVADFCGFNISAIRFFKNTITGTPVAIATTNPAVVCLTGANALAQNEKLIVEVVLAIPNGGCLTVPCPSIKFNLTWGCQSDFCKTATLVSKEIKTNPASLFSVLLERVSPVATAGGNDMNWDGSCTGDANGTNWEFIVRNNGTMAANSVTITLDKGVLNSNTYIDVSSVLFNYPSTLFNIVNPLAGVTMANTLFQTADRDALVNTCAVQGGQYDSKQITFTIPLLEAGEKMLIRFRTFRCCPVPIPPTLPTFNVGYTYNRWTIAATARNCSNTLVPVSYSTLDYINSQGTLVPLFAPNIAAMSGNGNNLCISANNFDGGPDLMLTQEYIPIQSDIVGGRPGCGNVSTFHITNKTFTSSINAGLSGWDQQLFCATSTTGTFSQNICGNTPRGQFVVQIINDVTGGLILNPGSTPTIRKGNTTWASSGSITMPGGGAAFIFDIAHTSLNGNNGTGEAFRNFFLNSKIFFELQGCCGDAGLKSVKINTYFAPNPGGSCNNLCYIPLAQQTITQQLHCPGCVTPGIIISEYRMERSSYGFEDIRNWGTANYTAANAAGLTPITTAYGPFAQLNLGASVVGDQLRSVTRANFYPGDNTLNGWDYTTWQSANAGEAFKWIYFQQEIMGPAGYTDPGIVPTAAGGTLTIQPGGTGPISIFTFPSLGHVTVSGGGSQRTVVITAISLDEINQQLPGLVFLPGDVYTLTLNYVVGANPTITPQQDITIINSAYFTASSIDLTQHPIPYAGPGASAIPTAGDLNIAPNYDPVLLPTQALYYCEGLTGHHQVYPVVPIYSEEWINGADAATPAGCKMQNSLCTKIGKITVGQRIWNNGNPNVFPFEYKLVPVITPANLNLGMQLQNTSPYYVRMKLPAGFSPTTTGAKVYSICTAYEDQANVRTMQNNIPAADLLFTPTGVNNEWDVSIDYSKAIYQPLLVNAANVPIHSGLTVRPYLAGCAQPQNIVANNAQTGNVNRDLLIVGDEIMEQHFEFNLKTACGQMAGPDNNNNNAGYTIANSHVFAKIPQWSNTQHAIADVDAGQNVGGSTLSAPNVGINITTDLNGSYYCAGGARVLVAITSTVPVNNFIVYFSTELFNANGAAMSNLVFSNFSDINGAIIPSIPSLNFGTYKAFKVNLTASSGSLNRFYIDLSITNCNNLATGSVLDPCTNLYNPNTPVYFFAPVYYTWSCEGVLDDIAPGSLTVAPPTPRPLPAPSCRSEVFNLAFQLPPASVNRSCTVTGNRTTCSPLTFDFAMQNFSKGGLFNIISTFTIPPGFTLDDIKYTVNSTITSMNTGGSSPTYTATPSANGTSCVVDFSPLIPFSSNCLPPVTTWGNGLNLQETIHILIYVTPKCNVTTMPQFKIYYSAVQFCGGASVTSCVNALPSTPFNITPGSCTPPVISLTPHDETCIGGNNAWIGATVTGNPIPNATPPYLYNWSNSSTAQNPDNLATGNYTVTVTDRFCTASASASIGSSAAVPFSRYIENWYNCVDALNDPFYKPDPNSGPYIQYLTPVVHDITTDKNNNVITGGTWTWEVNFPGSGYAGHRSPSNVHGGEETLGPFIAKYDESGNMAFPPIVLNGTMFFDGTELRNQFNYCCFEDLNVDVETDNNGVIFATLDATGHLSAYSAAGAFIRAVDLGKHVDPVYNGGLRLVTYKVMDDNIFIIGVAAGIYPSTARDLYFLRMSKSAFLSGNPNFILNSVIIPGGSATNTYLAMQVAKSGSNYYVIAGNYYSLVILDQAGNIVFHGQTGLQQPVGRNRISLSIDNSHIYITRPDYDGPYTSLADSRTLCYSYTLNPPEIANTAGVLNPVWSIQNEMETSGLAVDQNYVYTASSDRIKKLDKTTGNSIWPSTYANYQTWPTTSVPREPCAHSWASGVFSRNLALTNDGRIYVAGNAQEFDVNYNGTAYTNHPLSNFILRYCTNSGASYKTDGADDTTPPSMKEALSEALLQDMDIAVYPNPSSGLFNISCNDADCDIIFTVYNSLGAKVSQGNFAQKTVLNMKQQPAGIYYLSFKYLNADNKVVNRKIILDK